MSNRPIEFRARDLSGKLHYFTLFDVHGEDLDKRYFFIKQHSMLMVKDSVERSTGLLDRNGVKIFEGGVVNRYGEGLLGDPSKVLFSGPVEFTQNGWHIIDKYPRNMLNQSELEIIGNIHENPELLEGKS